MGRGARPTRRGTSENGETQRRLTPVGSHVRVVPGFGNVLGGKTSSLGDLSTLFLQLLGGLSLFYNVQWVKLGGRDAGPEGAGALRAQQEVRSAPEAAALGGGGCPLPPPVGRHAACFYFQGVWGHQHFLFVTPWSTVWVAGGPCAPAVCPRVP